MKRLCAFLAKFDIFDLGTAMIGAGVYWLFGPALMLIAVGGLFVLYGYTLRSRT